MGKVTSVDTNAFFFFHDIMSLCFLKLISLVDIAGNRFGLKSMRLLESKRNHCTYSLDAKLARSFKLKMERKTDFCDSQELYGSSNSVRGSPLEFLGIRGIVFNESFKRQKFN